ncbi:MAG: RNA-binding cell elongation regulator Jag/EloR [Desulfobacterales bacterium]
MTSGLEFEGKNIENAIKKACEKLNIREEKLKYDVISYGSTGIFGLVGTKKAKIRVTSPRQLKTRRPSKNNNDRESGHIAEEKVQAEITSVIEETVGEKIQHVEDQVEEISEAPSPHEKIEATVEKPDIQNDLKNTSRADLVGQEVLQKIVDLITTGAIIEIQKEKNEIKYNVSGGNSAILIGKKGQTLEAIQYIVEKIINKISQQKTMVLVDIEGYLENRKINLEKLSGKLAEKAKRIGRPVTMGQMSSHDRKVVHLVLRDDPGVRTQSIGNGFYRKLIIFPKKIKNKKV